MSWQRLFEDCQVWAQNLALQKSVRAGRSRCLDDEIRNAALVGLWTAAKRFYPGFGVPFKSYAYPRVLGEVADQLRKYHWWPAAEKRSRFCGAAAPPGVLRVGLCGEENDEVTGLGFELIPDVSHDRDTERVAVRERVDAALALVSCEQDRRLLRMYVVEGLSHAAIARTLGLSESRVCQIVANAIGSVRRRVNGRGDGRLRILNQDVRKRKSGRKRLGRGVTEERGRKMSVQSGLDLNQIVVLRECRAVLEGAFAALSARGVDALAVDPASAENCWVLSLDSLRLVPVSGQAASDVVCVSRAAASGPAAPKRNASGRARPSKEQRQQNQRASAYWHYKKKHPNATRDEWLTQYTPRRRK